jgi:glycosyltransferase involved in cell wall biosynthesis
VALIEVREVSLAALDERRLAGFFLDHPRAGSITETTALDVWGWVIGRGAPAVAVEVLERDRVIRRTPVDVPREDVARAYPDTPGSHLSGFATTLRLRPGTDRRISVRAVLKDQTRVPLVAMQLRTRWRADEVSRSPLVSVIIPCYRQAHYLGEALESVLAQTYPHVEIVVIDDGSPDNTGEVAHRYPGVRYLRQSNRGVSEARNLGIRSSNGSFLVFLDADDRLLPEAVALGLECFAAHQEVAFVSGRFRFVAADGTLLYERQGHGVACDHYPEMLRRNYIAALCATMCRRDVFESVVGFNPALGVAADYDWYLRVLREFPARTHDGEVAEYRRHGLGISADGAQVLRETLFALRAQRRHLRGNPALMHAYRAGVRHWKSLAADLMVRQARASWQDGRRGAALRTLLQLGMCGATGLATLSRRQHVGGRA